MKTIQQLEAFAHEELGLSKEDVSFHGPVGQIAAWQNAIEECRRSLLQERADFLPPRFDRLVR